MRGWAKQESDGGEVSPSLPLPSMAPTTGLDTHKMGLGYFKPGSGPIVLHVTLENLKSEFSDDHGVQLVPGELKMLCQTEQTSLGAGWPSHSTLADPTIIRVWNCCLRNQYQFPYIDE